MSVSNNYNWALIWVEQVRIAALNASYKPLCKVKQPPFTYPYNQIRLLLYRGEIAVFYASAFVCVCVGVFVLVVEKVVLDAKCSS